MDNLAEAAGIIRRQDNFIIISHALPDGDSIGSSVALALILEALGKSVILYCADRVPMKYRFLRGSERFTDRLPGQEVLERSTIIALDCSDPGRFERTGETPAVPKVSINIDHHPTNTAFASVNIIDQQAAATGEIIFEMLQLLDCPADAAVATALYTSIASDTGSFRFANVRPQTFRIAAALLELGADPVLVAQRVFEEKPLSAVLLLGEALRSLEIFDNKIATLTVSEEMLQRCGAHPEETEGLVNYARNIEGVEVGVLFYMTGDDIKVGLRSRTIDVSAVAATFNGGGHLRAAGCRISVPYLEARRAVIGEIRRHLPPLDGEQR